MKQKAAAKSGLVKQVIRRVEMRPRLALLLLTLAALGPFVAKPFNMDDPLFLWAAKHIQTHPGNPYDFMVNWYGKPDPMWDVTKNPPLTCYYLALAASLFGWSEIALHCAFLVPAAAAILGTYRLARQFCDRPLFAAITTLFMPVFLVCGTSVMCDTMMLAFWVWAVVFWVEGMAKQDYGRLAGSAGLMALAAGTKYFGICLVPLLAGYSLMKQRRIGWWAACLLIPIACMMAYQWVTFRLYGKGLLADAASYATNEKHLGLSQIPISGLTGLAFAGGCAAAATLLAPWVWRGRTLMIFSAGTVVLALAVFAGEAWRKQYAFLPGSSRGWVEAEVIFWAVGGVSVLGLAAADAWRRRDAGAYLLAAWIWGTFLFASFINWTVNGRSLLPMTPAVAILLARRLGPKISANKKGARATGAREATVWPVAVAAALALSVTVADYNSAWIARQSARETYAKYGHDPGTLWFLGHWGWQYYLEQLGALALTTGRPPPPNGDVLAITDNNTNMSPPNKRLARLREILPIGSAQWLAASSADLGAGFYSSNFGPAPFAFGDAPPGKVYVFVIGPPPETEPAKGL